MHHTELERRKKFIQEACRVAKERVIVVELTPEGFKKFHSFSNFQAVDLEWLERELNSLSEVEKYSGH